MRIRLLKLQDDDKKAKKLSLEGLPEGLENIEQMFHYQNLPYVSKIIRAKLISRQQDNPCISHFGIGKTWELIVRKYN